MMKRLYLCLGLALCLVLPGLVAAPVVGEAHAISRYMATSLSCGAIQSRIGNEGAVILRWTSRQTGNPLYDRYVASSRYCDPGEQAVPARVPSADRAACTVQKCKRCEVRRSDRRFGWRLRC